MTASAAIFAIADCMSMDLYANGSRLKGTQGFVWKAWCGLPVRLEVKCIASTISPASETDDCAAAAFQVCGDLHVLVAADHCERVTVWVLDAAKFGALDWKHVMASYKDVAGLSKAVYPAIVKVVCRDSHDKPWRIVKIPAEKSVSDKYRTKGPRDTT